MLDMLPEVGTKEFDEYLVQIAREHKPKRHAFYEETVKQMKAMGVHVTGDNPKNLLDVKRPNESKEAKDYRLKTYKPKTKASASKAISIINRIYNDRLFSVDYKPDPSNINKSEGLQNYLTEGMPLYVSLINYIKSVFTKMHLKDANGVIGIRPHTFLIEDTNYFEPIPIFYTSDEVVDFIDGQYFVLFEKKEGDQKVIIYTRETYYEFCRKKEGDDFRLEVEHNHGFNAVPAFRVRGVVSETQTPQWFESYISGVLPHWDDAVTMFSDLQAVIVNHIYPEKWEFTVDCTNDKCQSGMVNETMADGTCQNITCSTCHGTGKVTTKSPFDIYQVNRDALVPDAPLPTPPFGYGEKELESTKLLGELAEKEIQKGFEAINMDIINEVGENQSGVAKVIDRQDLDSFLDVYSSHVFNYILPNMILFITLWRYGTVLSEKEIIDYQPAIKEPTTFDVFSISLLTDELQKLKEAGVNGSFIAGLQKDIIEKRFSDEFTKSFNKAIIDLDPLAHLSNEDIMTQSRVIGVTEMTIHTYVKDLIEQALDADDEFLSKELSEQKETIKKLAEARKPKVIEVENGGSTE